MKFYKMIRVGFVFLCILISSHLFAQSIVTGKVFNNDKQAVADATVQVKGTQIATKTANDGSFSVNVPHNNDILVISYVGFQTIEIPVSGRTSIGSITFTGVSSSLNEVVVTGYSAQRKKDITGSVAVVNVSNLKSVPSGTTESLLQGQAAGVTVINTGAPGGNSNVRIRGITGVGSSDPLVIIDGTPGSLHDLNVNDIQSMQVLKDAGAAAIYGVRGSNGVIIITTKRGRPGKPVVTYDAYYGTQQPLSGNVWHIANPQETADAIWKTYTNIGLTPSHKQYGSGPTPVLPDYITPTGAKEGDPGTDPSTYALYTNQITKANKTGTDWFHEIFKPAHIQSHNLSVSGGGEKATYLFSFNYFDQPGTLINTYLKRYSTRINTTFTIKDHIRIGENAYVLYKQNPSYTGLPGVNSTNSINAAFRMPSIIPVHDIKGNYAGGASQSLGNAPNPVAIMDRTKNYQGNEWQIQGNLFAEVDFLKHFTVRSSFGGTVDNFYRNFFVFTAYENAENSTNPNSYIENYGYSSSWTWTNTLRYSNIIGKHNITVLAGQEAIENGGKAAGASRGSYFITNLSNLTVDPNLWTLNFGSPGSQTNSNIVGLNGIQTPYQSSIYSLFGRVDYNYNDKYLLSGTIRRDGASVFDPTHRFGIFPSVTAGWRISREDFFKDVSWINDLKIRGGWGKLGSISNINPTNAYTLYSQSAVQSYYDVGGTSNAPAQGIYNSQYGNPNTTWEEDVITNIGLDLTILKNKIDISAEWYEKAISGLLFPQSLPAIGGPATAPFVNSGNIQNKGVDIAVTYHGAIKRDLRFDITGTFTTYNNKVVGLPPGVQYIDYGRSRMQPGYALGAFYGYKVLGLFKSAEDVAKSPKQDAAAPGRFKYADINGDGEITDADRTHFGNPNPKFTSGLNISASYKNFDLFMFLYASVGNDVLNTVRLSTDFPQSFDVAISKDAVYNSWTPQNLNAKVPILERTGNFSNGTGAFNSYAMENGSFLRCKTLSLGYTIPVVHLKSLGIDRFRLYGQVANLFTITKYTGADPELPGSNVNFGIDGGSYPNNQKIYTFGVSLSF
ncbi:SusC/RagA family TonB-linked outer membrane protein [Segetibacter koreensis]|uniref:SusC/RagA family TonB-linked outer membrane protein n=1 Tax=Segetibacter koreensis TaxID=398037 RepID=UPI00035FE35F|nr:TonB-dependent receptor [Segetibacter koreensis]